MRKKQWANVIVTLIVLIVFVYGVKRIAEAPDLVSLFNPEVEISSEVGALKDKVLLETFRLSINQATKIVEATFELNNKSHHTVSDVTISCDFHDNNGEFWGRGNWKIYETLPPNYSTHYVLEDKRYISHRAIEEQTSCKIVDFISSGESSISDGKSH
jgi:hypothetical protein